MTDTTNKYRIWLVAASFFFACALGLRMLILDKAYLSIWLFLIFEFVFVLYGLISLFAANEYYKISGDRKLWLKKNKK